ncbi:hypothetical protein V8C40DRAFT_252028 [Trichoderma camerunense]
MTSIEDKIRSAATRNHELLGVLSVTDHGIPDLENQTKYIASLESQAKKNAAKLATLKGKHAVELREHENYRDSVVRRFVYKIGGKKDKFEARAAKEEREYFDVLQEEHKETEVKKNIESALAQARQASAELETVVQRHKTAQQELDSLYNDIFSGPTPQFPEEDEREQACTSAQVNYQEARMRAESQIQAIKMLEQAKQRMGNALKAMQDALSASRFDMFGGGTMADVMERNALSQAEVQLSQARMDTMNAQRMDPAIKDLPPVKISHGNLVGDVLFDNIFSDMDFHDKIKRSNAEVERCANVLKLEIQRARERHQSAEAAVKEWERHLKDARAALQMAREMAFERTLNGESGELPPAFERTLNGESGELPPAYSVQKVV